MRIEVLKAIGIRLTNSQRSAYCVATHSKPYLSVGPQQGMQGRRQSYKYVEAIKAFGKILDDTFLDRAYERAGMNFTGEIVEHTEVVSTLVTLKVNNYRSPRDDILGPT